MPHAPIFHPDRELRPQARNWMGATKYGMPVISAKPSDASVYRGGSLSPNYGQKFGMGSLSNAAIQNAQPSDWEILQNAKFRDAQMAGKVQSSREGAYADNPNLVMGSFGKYLKRDANGFLWQNVDGEHRVIANPDGTPFKGEQPQPVQPKTMEAPQQKGLPPERMPLVMGDSTQNIPMQKPSEQPVGQQDATSSTMNPPSGTIRSLDSQYGSGFATFGNSSQPTTPHVNWSNVAVPDNNPTLYTPKPDYNPPEPPPKMAKGGYMKPGSMAIVGDGNDDPKSEEMIIAHHGGGVTVIPNKLLPEAKERMGLAHYGNGTKNAQNAVDDMAQNQQIQEQPVTQQQIDDLKQQIQNKLNAALNPPTPQVAPEPPEMSYQDKMDIAGGYKQPQPLSPYQILNAVNTNDTQKLRYVPQATIDAAKQHLSTPQGQLDLMNMNAATMKAQAQVQNKANIAQGNWARQAMTQDAIAARQQAAQEAVASRQQAGFAQQEKMAGAKTDAQKAKEDEIRRGNAAAFQLHAQQGTISPEVAKAYSEIQDPKLQESLLRDLHNRYAKQIESQQAPQTFDVNGVTVSKTPLHIVGQKPMSDQLTLQQHTTLLDRAEKALAKTPPNDKETISRLKDRIQYHENAIYGGKMQSNQPQPAAPNQPAATKPAAPTKPSTDLNGIFNK